MLLAFTVGSLVQWEQGHTKGAVAAAALVVCGAALVWVLRSRGVLGPAGRPRVRVALAAAALGVALAAGYREQDHYLTHRYENTGQVQNLAEALRWSRDVRDARIALGGIRAVFTQYPFYGTDLSNWVQWLGLRGPHDAYNRIPDCRQWRQAINEGGYTHVVTTFDPYLPGRMRNSPEGRWTQSDPNARIVLRDGPVQGVRASRAARSRRLCRPEAAHRGAAPQRAQPQRNAQQRRLSPSPRAAVRARPLHQDVGGLEQDLVAADRARPDQGGPPSPVSPQDAAGRQPSLLGQPEPLAGR